ncbi:hypothetical protein V6Z11_A01G106900 [Gossypium hirsutum]
MASKPTNSHHPFCPASIDPAAESPSPKTGHVASFCLSPTCRCVSACETLSSHRSLPWIFVNMHSSLDHNGSINSLAITIVKLQGGNNYISWAASVELWFTGQGFKDHLEDSCKTYYKVWAKAKNLHTSGIRQIYKDEFNVLTTLSESVIDQEQQWNKFFMVLALIKLQKDAASVQDQILASPTIPTLDNVTALLL